MDSICKLQDVSCWFTGSHNSHVIRAPDTRELKACNALSKSGCNLENTKCISQEDSRCSRYVVCPNCREEIIATMPLHYVEHVGRYKTGIACICWYNLAGLSHSSDIREIGIRRLGLDNVLPFNRNAPLNKNKNAVLKFNPEVGKARRACWINGQSTQPFADACAPPNWFTVKFKGYLETLIEVKNAVACAQACYADLFCKVAIFDESAKILSAHQPSKNCILSDRNSVIDQTYTNSRGEIHTFILYDVEHDSEDPCVHTLPKMVSRCCSNCS